MFLLKFVCLQGGTPNPPADKPSVLRQTPCIKADPPVFTQTPCIYADPTFPVLGRPPRNTVNKRAVRYVGGTLCVVTSILWDKFTLFRIKFFFEFIIVFSS